MQLATIDWAIILGYFALIIGIGAIYSRRAGKNLAEFFVSGRSLPWWIAGTSMVATTFAADTPLAVVGLVSKNGLAGNWFWWAFALGGMFTVFVFAKLWRRSEVMTDVELIGIRYSGTPARALRYTRAVYVAMIVNPIIIGWVVGAMLTVLEQTVLFDAAAAAVATEGAVNWTSIGVVVAMLVVVGIYSTLSGMWGVAITDVLQFVIAMFGCIWLALVAVDHVGGVEALQTKVNANFGNDQAFSFLPDFSEESPWMPLHVFFIMLGIQWWATWYPGAEPGGGGYVVQRMAACKDETHALKATLWYQVAHYCIRPWPWLMVAFVALAMYPGLRDMKEPGVGFPMVMRDLCPPGLAGLMLVTFFSAFMSTISTQMNWGASYLVRDFYQPLFASDATDQQLTRYSRVASVVVLCTGGGVALLMKASGMGVDTAWKMLAALGAGTGAVYMLRWFWWRINAWTEIVAMLASLFYFSLLTWGPLANQFAVSMGYVDEAGDAFAARANHQGAETMAVVAALTIITWLIATFVTKPESQETLGAFYRKIRPGGPGWKPVAVHHPNVRPDGDLGLRILAALLGAGVVYSVLPAVGYLIFGRTILAVTCLTAGAVFGGVLLYVLPKIASSRSER